MRLTVLAPGHLAVDEVVDAIVAESVEGSFCLLPRHVDLVAVLVPSLLSYRVAGQERFLGVDGGTLVKCGGEVMVSTPRVVIGPELEELRSTVERSFLVLEERERDARAALARLESDILRRFVEFEHRG